MNAYFDQNRSVYGALSICEVLQIARRRTGIMPLGGVIRRCVASVHSATSHSQRVWQESHGVYGADKVWRQLNRKDIYVARCTARRLMRNQGLLGVRRGKRVRTTVADDAADRPLDRVNRQL